MFVHTLSETRRPRRSSIVWTAALLIVASCASSSSSSSRSKSRPPSPPSFIRAHSEASLASGEEAPSYTARASAQFIDQTPEELAEWCVKIGSLINSYEGYAQGFGEQSLLNAAAQNGGDYVTRPSYDTHTTPGYMTEVPTRSAVPFQTSTDWQGNTTLSQTVTTGTESRWVDGRTYTNVMADVWRIDEGRVDPATASAAAHSLDLLDEELGLKKSDD